MAETEEDIKELYRKLLNNPDFDRLELELRTPNIFEILGVSRTEIRHSNFLSWLLDPNGTHGLGKLFLVKFLRDLTACENAKLDVFEIEKLNFDNVELKREWKNPNVKLESKKERSIDLLIIFNNHVICIENKIGTQDSKQQLENYKEIVDKTFEKHEKENRIDYIYLTPAGDDPNDKEQRNDWVSYSYDKIIKQIESVLEVYGKSLNSGIYQYIFDYVTIFKRKIMQEGTEANELANKIYRNHKKLFDFVFENKPDVIKEIFEEKIEKEKSYREIKQSAQARKVRFLTEKLQLKEMEKIKECFWFEIWFNEKTALIQSVISPCDTFIQDILCKALESAGLKRLRGTNGWYVHHEHRWKWDTEITEIDKVREKIDNEWGKIKEVVEKVESALLKHEDEIKNCIK